ncbi:MAG TPA: SdrD B-like domain-containing protein [bacterium]
MSLTLDGAPVGAYLYLAGTDDNRPGGDPNVRVAITNGSGTTRVINVVPVVYATPTVPAQYVSRVEITRYLSRGKNTLAISGYDLETPDAAFVFAVFDGGADASLKYILVRDGADIGWYPELPPLGPDSEAVSFRFAPAVTGRQGSVLLAITDGDSGRGDEVLGFTGTGFPSDQLTDTDADGRLDIVNRRVALTAVDTPPRGNDPANAGGTLEARRGAFSLEEDCLGEPVATGGCAIGPNFGLVSGRYPIPPGHRHAEFQIQSEDPEDGDSFMLFFALAVVPYNETVDPLPDIQVVKNVTPTVMPEPGGPADFEVIVTIPVWSEESVWVTSLVDDVFGNLTGRGTCLLPRSLPRGGSYRCTFTAPVSGTVERRHRDVVTVSGVGMISRAPVSASDDAIVNFTRDMPGRIIVQKVTVPEGAPALQFGFTASYNAAGFQLANGQSNDSGDLVAGTYSVAETMPLPANWTLESAVCDDQSPVGAISLQAGETVTCVFTNRYTPTPGIRIDKTASPLEVYPGDPVTYTYTVTNTGSVVLVDITVTDDRIAGQIAAVPRLEPGESFTVTRTVVAPACGQAGTTSTPCSQLPTSLFGPVPEPHLVTCYLRNIATVEAYEPALRIMATDSDDACIKILPFSAVGNRVWEDLGNLGIRDAGEPGIRGVRISLLKDGVVIARTVTDDLGRYSFENLRAGTYVVDPDDVPGYRLTTGNDPLPVTLHVGEYFTLANFGFQLLP